MKIMFVLNHVLYLRNFQSVIADLAARGHDISLTFLERREGEDELVGHLSKSTSNLAVVPPPTRSGWWWPAADPLRALTDTLHYAQPAYAEADKARGRAAKRLPRFMQRMIAVPSVRAVLRRVLQRIEAALPPDPGLLAWLRSHATDVLVVSPLIDLDYVQMDLLKASARSNIRTVHAVASWDNLTNKGRIQITADRVAVWNAAQRDEAVQLHGVPADFISVTGAQLYDPWFTARPSRSREAFCALAGGLEPNEPVFLYAGSSPFICADETRFFTRWIERVRASKNARLRSAGVLIRPHPLHAQQWLELALPENVCIWPKAGQMPIDGQAMQDYYDSLAHSCAVVGINTSVFLEAAIVGRPVLTVRDEAFVKSQEGMLHFRHVLDGGIVRLAQDWEAHLADLASAMEPDNPADDAARRRFLESFVRPHGIDVAATPSLSDAIEQTPWRPKVDRSDALSSRALRALLWPLAAHYLRPNYLAALARRSPRHPSADGAGH